LGRYVYAAYKERNACRGIRESSRDGKGRSVFPPQKKIDCRNKKKNEKVNTWDP